MAWIETCTLCGRPFSITEAGSFSGKDDPEPIDCPHCKHVVMTRKSTGVFITKPVTPKEEKELGDED
jgi:DNA-directed RNA polymerase subunit RPC12/RpoP